MCVNSKGYMVSMAHLYVFEMRFDLGTLDSGERSLPFGLLVGQTLHLLPYFMCVNSKGLSERLVLLEDGQVVSFGNNLLLSHLLH